MPNRRISMRKIKEVLRLKYEAGLSNRAIARSCNISHKTVREYLKRAEEAGITWPLPEGMDDEALEKTLFTREQQQTGKVELPDMAWVHRELRRKGVTKQLLWQEFCESSSNPCSYSWFCEAYRKWQRTADPVMRQSHKAGEKMYVDFAGVKVPITDPTTGEIRKVPVFVAVLGASSYTYAEATEKEDLESFINAHIRAFEFFGGVPEVVVPDNLKAGVRNPLYYEPDINPTYQEMATHYRIAVIPARVRRPRDKAKVEVAVQVVERWILAALRNRTFFSISELNTAIRELLEKLNERKLRKLDVSRRELFENIEKPALKPLPKMPYRFAIWKRAKVNIDYHIEVDRHYYSVPYQFIGKKVDVRITQRHVEVFYKGKRIAAHLRSRQRGQHTTCEAHMPENHRLYKKGPINLEKEAACIGSNAAQLAKAIMESKSHPVQGYRAIMGIIRLSKAWPKERVDAACARALAIGAYSYRSVRSILEKGLDQVPFQTDSSCPSIKHRNIRGADYYKEGDKTCW